MGLRRETIRAAIVMTVILAIIIALASYFTWFDRPPRRLPPVPSGYLTEPPIVTDRTKRPPWKTEYPTAAIRTVSEDGPANGGGK